MTKYHEITVIGDSIAYGAYDEEGGWAERLKKELQKLTTSNPKVFYMLYNLGIDGDTTDGVRERLENEVKSRTGEDINTVIFEIGGNDASYLKNSGTFRVNKERFRDNIEWIIEKSRKYFKNIIFLGLLPVNEKLTSPFDDNEDLGKIFYKDNYAQDYNSILRVICETQKVMFIDLFEEFKRVNYKKLLFDGLHPNTKGYEFIFETVKGFLEKNKLISSVH